MFLTWTWISVNAKPYAIQYTFKCYVID